MLVNIAKKVNSYLPADHIPKFKLSHYQNNYCFQAPKMWNLLSSSVSFCCDITNAPTLNSMKTRLKRFLLKMQSYGDQVEWIDANKSISTYLTSIKKDPHFDNKR